MGKEIPAHTLDTGRLTVIGTGYLGVTHAARMASLGVDVLGMDVDHEKIKALSAGDLPFYEPGLEELMRQQIAAGRLRFTVSFEEVAAFADVHFCCVGTPQRADGLGADVRFVDAVVEGLAPRLADP